jgi:DNA (cytosine-5)-methyltransferase 1
VPRWRDIHEVTKESFYERIGRRTTDIISGGFPCQPFSVSGKRKGKDDDRYLWPEMLRVIQELQPSWVFGENVAGLLNLGIEKVLSELEGIGYPGGVLQIPACSVGAWHIRSRLFILAYSNGKRWDELAETFKDGRAIQHLQGIPERWDNTDYISFDIHGILSKPMRGVQRNDDGVPTALDRLKCLGNAVVPQQAYPIFRAIADIENGVVE